jgi:hypothetical protein
MSLMTEAEAWEKQNKRRDQLTLGGTQFYWPLVVLLKLSTLFNCARLWELDEMLLSCLLLVYTARRCSQKELCLRNCSVTWARLVKVERFRNAEVSLFFFFLVFFFFHGFVKKQFIASPNHTTPTEEQKETSLLPWNITNLLGSLLETEYTVCKLCSSVI